MAYIVLVGLHLWIALGGLWRADTVVVEAGQHARLRGWLAEVEGARGVRVEVSDAGGAAALRRLRLTEGLVERVAGLEVEALGALGMAELEALGAVFEALAGEEGWRCEGLARHGGGLQLKLVKGERAGLNLADLLVILEPETGEWLLDGIAIERAGAGYRVRCEVSWRGV